VEKSGCGLFKVIPWYLLGGSEENHKKISIRIVKCPKWDLNKAPPELLLTFLDDRLFLNLTKGMSSSDAGDLHIMDAVRTVKLLVLKPFNIFICKN
jgi:hypothetical protein